MGITGLTFSSPSIAQTPLNKTNSQVKKIVMMMNIVNKEYAEGISNGKVINAAEYEESQVFLSQANDRFHSISQNIAKDLTEKFEAKFQSLKKTILAKADPLEINQKVNSLNTDILKAFGVELSKTPTEPVSLENGRNLYMNNCKICHGVSGQGDGPIAEQLDPKPAVLADPNITGNKLSKPYDNFQIINVGIAGTAMVGWGDQFKENEIWDLTYFIRTFSNSNVEIPLIVSNPENKIESASGRDKVNSIFKEVNTLLADSLETFKSGDNKAASEKSFDAYLTYEKLESPLLTKRKELGLRLESLFGRLQAEMKRNASIDLVQKIVGDIQTDLDEAQKILTQKIGFFGLFIQSLSIIVREGFEAILIVAALITFLIKSKNRDKLKSVYMGVGIGIIGSFITAYILKEILKISTASQELMEGWIMLIAMVVLFYVSYWLVSKIETARWQSYITGKMQQAVSTGSAFTLGTVAFLSVYREGFETILFYKALYLYAGEQSGGIVPGFFAGCLLLAVVYFLINKIGLRIPVKWFFAFTSVFLYFLAFVFMGKGLHELQMGNQISMTVANFAPEIPWLGMYPTWETFIGQMVLLIAYAGALIYTFGIKMEKATQDLKVEANQIQKNITVVHDLVEHISHHAKRCEIFLKDTQDHDLKELSEHLKEIDEKVHELFDQVKYFENQLKDDYDRISQPIATQEKELH